MKATRDHHPTPDERRTKMIHQTKRFMQGFISSLALAAAILTIAPTPAKAATQGNAGNTVIRNKVTISYQDAGANPFSTTASVDISVTTVNVAPTIYSTAPGTTATTTGTGTTATYTVELVTNSNGPGTITLGAVNGATTNTTPGATTVSGGGTTFLGSTIIDPSDAHTGSTVVAAGGSITFNVPNDNGSPSDTSVSGGTFADGVVNGLKNGDKVYIYSGTQYYGLFDVGVVVENPLGLGTTAAVDTIQLTNSSGAAITLPFPATTGAGWMIVERKTLAVTVTQGAVTGSPASWITNLTPSMGGVSGAVTPVTTTATVANLNVIKYVRNVTTPVAGTTSVSPTINGATNTYYITNVTGKPGDIMEYLFVINNVGSANATKVTATDSVPTYTKLQTLFTGSGFAVAKRSGSATEVILMPNGSVCTPAVACGNTTGGLLTAGTPITIYLGNNSANNLGGEIAAAETAYVIYQVKVD
jgi:hypothetical protein